MKKIILILFAILILLFILSCQTVPKQSVETIKETKYTNLPPHAQLALNWFKNHSEEVKRALSPNRIIYERLGTDPGVLSNTFGGNDRIRLPNIPGFLSANPIFSYDYKRLYVKITEENGQKSTVLSISAHENPRVLYNGDFIDSFDVSPSESEMAFYRKEDSLWQLYRYNLKTHILTQFSNPHIGGLFCNYSPDGKLITYCADRKLRIKNIHTSKEKILVGDGLLKEFPRWSHNGKWIVYQASLGNGESYDIYKVKVSNGKITRLTNKPGMDANPSFDAADRHIIYMSSPEKEQGSQILWVMNADGNNKKPDPTSDFNVYFPNF